MRLRLERITRVRNATVTSASFFGGDKAFAVTLDPDREALAREVRPVHVPREPRPVVRVDEGPLVLVETRKDLSQYKLPFETAAPN